ncbi:MAG: hypothetical protein ACXU9D_11100 [Xanthobacteraceae bacterium]
MAAAGNELEGAPLRYLIGSDGPWDGRDGELIMAPYGTAVAPRRGYSAKYVNLYREDGEPQGYGPYLPRTATAREYDEGVPDPNGPGFWRNLEEQLALAKRGGFAFIETDNRDAYSNATVLKAFDRAAAHGLKVLCKNPGTSDHNEDATPLLAHPNVFGAIIEEGDVTPAQIHLTRSRAGKPALPIYFVSFGDGRGWATRMAKAITTVGYANMSVTHSGRGEYASSTDILLPMPGKSDRAGGAAPPVASARVIDDDVLAQVGSALSQIAGAAADQHRPTVAAAASAPLSSVLSAVDKALGGEALVGKKTAFAILAYAALSIFQALGAAGTATGPTATTAGQIMTTLIAGFGALGMIGKIDRGIKMLGLIAASCGAARS